MNHQEIAAKIKSRIQMLQYISFQLLIAVCVMGALPVLEYLPPGPSLSPIANPTIFLAIGIVQFTLSIILKRLLFKPSPQHDLLQSLSSYFTASIVACAVAEGIAVIGLVSFALNGSKETSIFLSCLAALGIWLSWPKASEVTGQI